MAAFKSASRSLGDRRWESSFMVGGGSCGRTTRGKGCEEVGRFQALIEMGGSFSAARFVQADS